MSVCRSSSFYLTSMYDHSVNEAFSKIVQNQIRQLRVLEHMLDLVTSVRRAINMLIVVSNDADLE
jgi:hypothetical protein